MIVRRAELKDVPRLIELGEKFALDSQKAHGLSISRKKIGEFADLSVTAKIHLKSTRRNLAHHRARRLTGKLVA